MENLNDSLEDQFQKLESILVDFVNFELINYERIPQIEEIMSKLYKDECRAWNLEEGYIDSKSEDEYEDDEAQPTVDQLYGFVENKNQFINEYKKVFSITIFRATYLSPDEIDEFVENLLYDRDS